MINHFELLRKECESSHISLTDRQEKQFLRYYEILVEWNRSMNLTAITDFEEVLLKHFADSLSVGRFLDLEIIHDVIDIGTGAGFPGIPLKIAFPHLNVTLLDSLGKRVKFLDEVIGELQLESVNTIHGRAEEYAKKKNYRESFDLCVSRAVANLAVLSEYCLPYVREDGYFVPYKSGNIDEELKNAFNAISILGGKTESVEKFVVGSGDDSLSRSLLFIRKISNTPSKYPRKAGFPSKDPL